MVQHFGIFPAHLFFKYH